MSLKIKNPYSNPFEVGVINPPQADGLAGEPHRRCDLNSFYS
jgi:hypothetical protein